MDSRLLKTESQPGITVVTLLTPEVAPMESLSALWESIIRLIPPGGAVQLVLDFSKVQFLSSAALGGLMRVAQKARGTGSTLRLYGVTPTVNDVLRLTRMDRVVRLCGSRDEALRAD